MKTISILVAGILCANANTISLDDLKNFYDTTKSAYKNISNQFTGLRSKLPSSLQQCINTDRIDGIISGIGSGLDNLDKFRNMNICEKAKELDNLKVKICGSSQNIISSSAIISMCNNAIKKFEDYSSKKIGDYSRWEAINTSKSSNSTKLPNGQTQSQYNKNWDIENVMKTKNTISSYLTNGNMIAINTIMDYAKSSSAKTDINKIQIEDIKAPQTLEKYDEGIINSVIQYQSALREISAKKLSGEISKELSSSSPNNYAKVTSEYLEKQKVNFDIAKNIEISNVLANSDYKKISIPTDQYVQTMRSDLRPVLVGQIRKQQAYEVSVVSAIEEKYQKKFDIATLLADKEIIMAQSFDEESAKAQIEQIANSSSKKQDKK